MLLDVLVTVCHHMQRGLVAAQMETAVSVSNWSICRSAAAEIEHQCATPPDSSEVSPRYRMCLLQSVII